jgi:uncharacterized cupin superfamily protein
MLRIRKSPKAKGETASRTRSIPSILLIVAGSLALVLAVDLIAKAPTLIGYKADLGTSERHELTPDPVDPSWITSGSPVFHSTVFEGSAGSSEWSGIWECIGPASFVWHYSVDEVLYVLEGSAEIDYMGRRFTLQAGDSTEFVAGTTASWVVNGRVKKVFKAEKPGRLVQAARGVFEYVGF